MADANFERIDTVKGPFFTYVVGHFRTPDVHVIGAMDLDDQGARDGGESDTVLYFLVTPEEWTWFENDRTKFDDLAQRIQIRMPKNRFFAAMSRTVTDPKAVQELVKKNLGDDDLGDDEAFNNWVMGLREAARKKGTAEGITRDQTVRIPDTPLNQARHDLALHQLEMRKRDKAIAEQRQRMKDMSPDADVRSEAEALLQRMLEDRSKAAAGGAPLEDALGNRIFTSEAIYVACDTCWKPDLPLISPATGTICIFSTEEIANHYMELVTRNNRLFPAIRKIERNQIKNFLRSCEMLGIITLLVDDGTEPVHVLLKNVIPRLDRGYIETHNCAIRNVAVRNMQVSAALNKHGREMDEEWRLTQNDHRATLDRNMLQEMGHTVFFLPCGLPEKETRKLKGHYVYTERANAKIHWLCGREKIGQPAMARAGFVGQHIVLQGTLKLPLRLVTVNNDKQMLMAFTSREEAMAFIQSQKNLAGDTVVAMSMDELQEAIGSYPGILVDPHSLTLVLTKEIIEKCIALRDEKKIIYNHRLKDQNGDK